MTYGAWIDLLNVDSNRSLPNLTVLSTVYGVPLKEPLGDVILAGGGGYPEVLTLNMNIYMLIYSSILLDFKHHLKPHETN